VDLAEQNSGSLGILLSQLPQGQPMVGGDIILRGD
jgi:hypothetical protein